MRKYIPAQDYIIMKASPSKGDSSVDGIYLPSTSFKHELMEIVAVGPDCKVAKAGLFALSLFTSSREVRIDEDTFFVIREREIIAVTE